MEAAILGLVLDSSVLIAAERRKRTPAQVIEETVKNVGTVPVILSALTVAEVGHGIFRANTPEIRERRKQHNVDGYTQLTHLRFTPLRIIAEA